MKGGGWGELVTNHCSLLMNKHDKIFEDLIYFPNLLLDFLNTLFSFLDDSLIEGNLII